MISVGNLAMGGRGKSPLVAHLARRLVEAGERPAILSRGYGRRVRGAGVVVVSDGRHRLADLDRAGDEPMMLAREAPGAAVLVCRDRRRAGALAERRFGASVHLLDDGFQHLALGRDVDIVVVAPEDLGGRAMPFGRLREAPAALAAADAVIVDAGAADAGAADGAAAGVVEAALARLAPSARVFHLRRHTGAAAPLDPGADWPPAGRAAVVAAGIVGPSRLAAAAREQGWMVRETMAFGDHHRYTRRDVERIAAAVAAARADVVLTTAKDAARLRPLRPLPVRVGVLPLTVSVEPAAAFEAWLFGRLRARSS